MIQQTAPIVATAILNSLCAGAICYILLKALVVAGKGRLPIIMYHLCNIMLLIPLIVFVQPLSTIGNVPLTAPILPAGPTTIKNEYITTPYTPGMAEVTAAPGASFSLSGTWAEINTTVASYSNVIMILYIAGLLLFSVRLLLQYLQSRHMKTRNVQHPDAAWLRLLNSTKKKLGIDEHIDLAFTTRNISPCIIGHAKAMILIPVSLANNLTTEQAEAILLHELAHYKQYDYYINLLTQCINCILFFNPFAWLITKQANNYRELACDATAANNGRNIELAETLAIIARIQVQQNSLSLSLQEKGTLLKRVQALLNIQPERSSNNRLLPFTLVTLVAATVLMFTGNTKIFSGERDNTREKLQSISKQMYDEGNFRYIFVDAVLDSLVQLPFEGDLVFFGGQSLVMQTDNNYKPMTKKLQQKYSEKLQAYLSKMGEDANGHASFSASAGKRIRLDDILSSSSHFRRIDQSDLYTAGITTRAWKRIFTEMYEDGLVRNATDKFRMEYDKDGIIINEQKLQGVQDSKYRRMFKDILGLNLEGDNISGSMRMGDLERYLAKADKKHTGWTDEDLDKVDKNAGKMEKTLFREMHKDGLLDTNYKMLIVYTPGEIWVNNMLLAKAMERKYTELFKSYNSDLLVHDNYSIAIMENEKLPYPAYEKLHGKLYLLQPDKEKKAQMNKWQEDHDENMKLHEKAMLQHEKAMEQYDKEMAKYDKEMEKHDKEMAKHDKEIEEHDKEMAKHDLEMKKLDKEMEKLDREMKKHDDAMVEYEKAMKEHEKAQEVHKKNQQLTDKLGNTLKADKLIRDDLYYLVEYRIDGLYINARKLENSMAAKYDNLLASLGYKKGSGAILERIPDGVAVPDWKHGNSTFHLSVHGNNLPAIAEKMFTEGNPSFILAYALHDGLLKERQNYSIAYDHGKIKWQGKLLKEPYASKYSRLMTEFFKAHGKMDTYTMRGEGITIKNLNDPSSSVRQQRLVATHIFQDMMQAIPNVSVAF